MSEGYKVTELGDIPEDWNLVRLGDIGVFKNGINKSKEDFGRGVPFVNLLNVFGKSLVEQNALGLVNANERELKEYSLQAGDVLFIRSSVKPSGVGLAAIIPKDFKDTVFSGFLIRYRDNGCLNTWFKRYCFSEVGFRNRLLSQSSVSANTNINQKALESLKIPLPPLHEQQKIASILSTVDEKIEVIDAQISQTQELKKGLMQQLLSKGIGHTLFKSSELGDIPESWEVVRLGDVADVSGGKRLPKGKNLIGEVTGHPYIRVADMFMGGVRLKNVLYVPDEVFPEISRYTIKAGDLFISVAGTLGIVGIVPNELDGANLTENANKISNIKIDEIFLYFLMTSSIVQDLIKKEQTNNAQPKLALTRIREFKIPVPLKGEQTRIGSILVAVDNKLQSLQSRKETYQQLKKGLMQQLLTGKIRVNISHNEPALA